MRVRYMLLPIYSTMYMEVGRRARSWLGHQGLWRGAWLLWLE